MFAEVIVVRVVTGLVSAAGVVLARVQGLLNHGARGGNMSPLNVVNGRAYNGSSAVIAAVLDGTLEVLAGEVCRAVNIRTVQMFAEVIVVRVVTGLVSALGVVTARVQGLLNHGARGGNMSHLNVMNGRAYNGSSAVIAAVLDGTLEVLAGEEAGAINTRNKRHLGSDFVV